MLRPLVSISHCRPWELTWCFSWLIYSISPVSSSLLLFTPLICLSSLSSANPSNLHPVHALTLSDFLGDFWPWVWVLVLGSKTWGHGVKRMSAWHLQQRVLIWSTKNGTIPSTVTSRVHFSDTSFFVRQSSLNDLFHSLSLSSDFQTTPLVGVDGGAKIDRMNTPGHTEHFTHAYLLL